SPQAYQLGPAIYALKKGQYRLIKHTAWHQELPLGERSTLIRLAAGEPVHWQEAFSVHEFDSVMTFKQMRGYIHTTIDCLFQRNASHDAVFRLKQSARIKLNEIEYID